ncbi:MAG: SH3 domain-containing protein [Spirochaetia bacterium]|nr:SH3 domain-containing protein [Spirochaetia bacterium]
MNIPSLSPEPISHHRKQRLYKNKRIIYSLMAAALIFTMIWLITKRFAQDPLDKIDSYLLEKKLNKAADLNYKLLKLHPEHRLALLMNGSVINFGIREMNITDTHLPFYEYDNFLEKEDKTGVFTRQSFLKKFTLFPDSTYFLDEFCHFNEKYPESIRNPESSVIILHSFHSKTIWNKTSDECMHKLFNGENNLKGLFAVVSANNLSMREKPEKKSKVLNKLKRDEKILIKIQGFEETIGNKKANWYFILNENQIYGWVFGAYLEKLQ